MLILLGNLRLFAQNISATGTLTSFTSCAGNPSTSQDFTVEGTSLTNDIIITAPTGYEIKLNSDLTYGASVTLTQISGNVSTTTINARLMSNAVNGASGNIVSSSSGASAVNIATGTAVVTTLVVNPITGPSTVCVGSTINLFSSNLITTTPIMVGYSLRKLIGSHSGPAVKVRRSIDNVETDIGFTSSGDLDEAALKTFAGTGNDAFVTIWYDQSGNGKNMTQTNTSLQPKILFAGNLKYINSRPTIDFYLNKGLFFNTTTNLASVSAVIKSEYNAFPQYHTILGSGNNRLGGLLENNGTNFHGNVYPSALWKNGTSLASNASLNPILNTPMVISYTTTIAPSGTTVGLCIGNYNNGTNGGAILQSEVIGYATTVSSTDRQIIEVNQGTYYGVSGVVGASSSGTGAWSSDDTNIADVDATTGVVTGKVAGNVNINYTLTSGSCSIIATKNITVNSVPTITSFTPASATTGATVTITGTNFTGASVVNFGGTAATSFTVVSSTSITAVLGNGTTGSVGVTTNNCTATRTGFTFISSDANLSALSTSAGTLSPMFVSGTIAYIANVSNATTSITVTPTKSDANATITVNGTTITSGSASGSIALVSGTNTITTIVTAQDGSTTKIYTITVNRGLAPTIINFNNVAKNYFDASFTITAPTSNSTGAFTYSSSNSAVATISGTTVTINGAGSATITATQAGDATYYSSSVTSTLTVSNVSVVTKNGQVSTSNANFVSKNGVVGGDYGVNQNGMSQQTKSYDLTTGLVMHLDAGNAASYSGTGTTWTDLSGNGNNGTLINNPTYNSSNNGNLVFNGSNTYVDVPLTKTASCTFSVWTKSSSANNMLFNAGNDGSGPDLFFNGGIVSWNTWDSSNNPFGSIPATASNGNWHNYILVNDAVSNTAKLYYDGVLYGTAGYRNASTNTKLYIGGSNGSWVWNGAIGNFQVHNRILTSAEVLQNFNALKTRYGL
ncbi:beta strand repeat-containing protein [Pedobacter cryophilus]|uniref:beta strand repeat-containing protein n=1 Tax=Pedobacter cryophilus TaxID=2571271 RepID=UPI00145E365C|nr:cadherin-like beta sandwich domain-containing protein [Pedobacter cryophilus]